MLYYTNAFLCWKAHVNLAGNKDLTCLIKHRDLAVLGTYPSNTLCMETSPSDGMHRNKPWHRVQALQQVIPVQRIQLLQGVQPLQQSRSSIRSGLCSESNFLESF